MQKFEDRIFISKNRFLINGFFDEKFSNGDELSDIIKLYFLSNDYSLITIFKIIRKANKRISKKVGVIVAGEGQNNVSILCDKEYINILINSLREIEYSILQPSKYKNLTKELK